MTFVIRWRKDNDYSSSYDSNAEETEYDWLANVEKWTLVAGAGIFAIVLLMINTGR